MRDELTAARVVGAHDVDADHIAAQTHLRLGDIDAAEPFAVAAVEQWAGSDNHRHALLAPVGLVSAGNAPTGTRRQSGR